MIIWLWWYWHYIAYILSKFFFLWVYILAWVCKHVFFSSGVVPVIVVGVWWNETRNLIAHFLLWLVERERGREKNPALFVSFFFFKRKSCASLMKMQLHSKREREREAKQKEVRWLLFYLLISILSCYLSYHFKDAHICPVQLWLSSYNYKLAI